LNTFRWLSLGLAALIRLLKLSGLREKADAFICAFVEWQGAKYLISVNRLKCNWKKLGDDS